MVKSRLSDEEVFQVGAFVAAQNTEGLVLYLNQLLYHKGLGTDGCSRPIAARDKEDMGEPCYAAGYIKKIVSFIKYTGEHQSAKKTLELTLVYLKNVQSEIAQFFKKRG